MDYALRWLLYLGQNLLIPVIVLGVFFYMMKSQAKFLKGRAESDNAQTMELQKIGRSLDRIAASLEART